MVELSNSDGKHSQRVIKLLQNPDFQPGMRPANIDEQKVPPEGLMYKEQPKQRRPTSISSAPRQLDKWYNTGGIKSASDRFDPATGIGALYLWRHHYLNPLISGSLFLTD